MKEWVNYGCIRCKHIITGPAFKYDGSNCATCGGPITEVQIIKLPEKKKFTLAFDEPPALVFVQHKLGRVAQVYQDGKQLNGVRAITIRASVDDITTHEIEFLTGATKHET